MARPTCFIAMPVTTHPDEAELYKDSSHWEHVLEALFVPAVESAGFEPIRPVASGSHLIHGLIIQHLVQSDLVLCDLSGHNPNVFFELGVRTSLNKPIALIRDEHTDLPFDTSGINTHKYSSALHGWRMEQEKSLLSAHTIASADSCAGQNPLWRQFGLTITATEPSPDETPLEAKVDLLSQQLNRFMTESQRIVLTQSDEALSQSDLQAGVVDGVMESLLKFLPVDTLERIIVEERGRRIHIYGKTTVQERNVIVDICRPSGIEVIFHPPSRGSST